MYQPTGHSIQDYLFRVPLYKLEQLLQFPTEEYSQEVRSLVEEILRLRKLDIGSCRQPPAMTMLPQQRPRSGNCFAMP